MCIRDRWYVLSVPIHEGGHLICGLLTGYRFVSFRAGRFICYRRQGKLRIGRYQIAGTGGQCLLGPPGASPDAPFPVSYTHLDVYKRQALGAYGPTEQLTEQTLAALRAAAGRG